MPKELFNQNLVNDFDNDHVISAGKPGVPNAVNMLWSRMKAILQESSGSVWGAITGNIADQDDLVEALAEKSDTTHNHNLADLSEKSYNSLTDKPSIPSISGLESQSNKETSALDISTTKYPCNNVVKVETDGIKTRNEGYTYTASAASTTAMNVSSTYHQHLTGTTTHIHTLPQTTTLTLGRKYHFFNRSTGIWTLNAYDTNKIMYLAPNCGIILQCIDINSDGVSSWKILANTECIEFHATDLKTPCQLGANQYYKFAGFACEVVYVWAGLLVAQCTGSTFIVDMNNNGNSMLDTKLSIDASEDTSLTAATQPVLNSTYKFITKGAKLTVDNDQIGATIPGTGLYIVMEVIRT